MLKRPDNYQSLARGRSVRFRLLAIALLPMSGLAVMMVQDTALFYPSFGRELANIVLAAVVVLELAGPLAVQLALKWSGEIEKEEA